MTSSADAVAARATAAFAPADIPRIMADSRGSSMRTNPVILTDAEVTAILAACL